MSAVTARPADSSAVLPDLLALAAQSIDAAEGLLAAARQGVEGLIFRNGRLDQKLLEGEQFAAHGYAWYATYVEALRQLLGWARRLDDEGRLGELEALIVQAGFGEYLAQMAGGIAMSQVEVVRPTDLGVSDSALHAFYTPAVATLVAKGNTAHVRSGIAHLVEGALAGGSFGETGLDETLSLVRDQFRRFADERVIPHAHEWHLKDEFIPMEIVREMGDLGVFGLTIPEEYGGLGLGKTSMCVVSEELSRGYIGVGSLGTRSEIAAELILNGGTEEQKQSWLPRIASAEVLPTAVFTEPNTGSDLGSLRTRAVKDGDSWKVTGNKTWITHAARAHVMTLLARTDASEPGYKGLSMFLAEKQPGDDAEPFPDEGIYGGEIKVLGYRGMKEYTVGFDGFPVKAENLLGAEPGRGFKQLMTTFESARIQTAARAVGVAQAALEIGLRYALERQQFGKPIFAFPRVHGKVAWMVVEIMIARQLTWFSAREKDAGRRCDLEAGMAKLLGARVAWACADNAVQIHGGNGYAEEYPISRVLCDARILNVFEGAAEIQANVIARRLLEGAN
ncbi:acyl-CoA dehydrogenase family protein [Zavarzinia sp. CC-PAN008]|uniref:acyl-CoA dehydrogenase family protein n=1 Tax=Zavarzinia sp. CC-PAN008 TaxID=3243332 RepID=UPI003F74453F